MKKTFILMAKAAINRDYVKFEAVLCMGLVKAKLLTFKDQDPSGYWVDLILIAHENHHYLYSLAQVNKGMHPKSLGDLYYRKCRDNYIIRELRG